MIFIHYMMLMFTILIKKTNEKTLCHWEDVNEYRKISINQSEYRVSAFTAWGGLAVCVEFLSLTEGVVVFVLLGLVYVFDRNKFTLD